MSIRFLSHFHQFVKNKTYNQKLHNHKKLTRSCFVPIVIYTYSCAKPPFNWTNPYPERELRTQLLTLRGSSCRTLVSNRGFAVWHPGKSDVCTTVAFFFWELTVPRSVFFWGGFQLWKMLGFTLRLCSVCYLIRIERFWRGSSVSNGILGAWMSGFVAQPFHFGGIAFALAIGTIWDYGIPCHPTVMAIIRRFGTSSLVCDKPQWRKLESWTCHTCQSCQSEILFQEVWRKKVRL